MATDYRGGADPTHPMQRGEHYRIVLGHPALSFAHGLAGQFGNIIDWIDQSLWVVPLNRTPPANDAPTAVLDVVVYPAGVNHTVLDLVSAVTNASTGFFGFGTFVFVLSVELLTGSQVKLTGQASGDSSRAAEAVGAASQLEGADPFRSTIGDLKTILVIIVVLIGLGAVASGSGGLKQWL